MTGMKVGYIRVSTVDQNPARQLDGIPVDKTFIDYASGKNYNREKFEEMMSFVREGDSIYVHSMDRLARNVDHLRKIINLLKEKKVSIHFVKENLTFNDKNDPMSTLLLTLMGAFAEFEYSILRERQREGIELAKKRGVFPGRKRKLSDDQIKEIQNLTYEKPDIKAIAKQYGISKPTVYTYLKSQIKEK